MKQPSTLSHQLNLSRLSLRDMEYVVAVADAGSFVKAADRCHVAQPSLSVQVRRIEERLQTTIFERASQRVLTTPEGYPLIEQMRKVLKEAHSLLAMALGAGKPFGGTLRISAISTLGPYYFPKMLHALQSAYPDTELVLGEGKTDDLIGELARGDVDAMLIADSIVGSSVRVEPVFEEPFQLACPSNGPVVTARGNPWAAIPPDQRLLLEEGHCLRAQALAACGDVAHRYRKSTSLETLRYMVAAGDGYTLMPALAATPQRGIRYMPLPASFARRIVLVWRDSDPRESDFMGLASLLRSVKLPALAGSASQAELSTAIA